MKRNHVVAAPRFRMGDTGRLGRRALVGLLAAGLLLAFVACAQTYTEAEVHAKENRELRDLPETEKVEDAASRRIQMEGGVNAAAEDDEAEEVISDSVGGPEEP